MQVITTNTSSEEDSGSGRQKSIRNRCQGLMKPLIRRQSTLSILKEHDRQKRPNEPPTDLLNCCPQPLLDSFRQNNEYLNGPDHERLNIVLEIFLGECDHVNDLNTAIKRFMEPIHLLRILDSTESYQIFYTIENILPVFERLVSVFSEAIRKNSNFTVFVQILADWVGSFDDTRANVSSTSNSTFLEDASAKDSSGSTTLISAIDTVVNYISHLYEARECLESIRNHKQDFADFLARCHTTTFSKRLDLWHFLDSPRTRLLRYPLLVNRLIKLTSATDPDLELLLRIRNTLSHITKELNNRAGEAMCRFHLRRIQLSASLLHSEIITRQKLLLLSGTLKTKQGPIKAFVFSEVMLLTVTGFQTVSASKSMTIARSNNSDSNASLTDVLKAKCTISHISQHWRALTTRRSSYNEPKRSSSSFSQQNITSGSPTELQTIGLKQRRGMSEPFIPLPKIAPHLERYRVYKQPILLRDCVLENLYDGQARFPSLRRTLLLDNTGNNMFRIHQNSATKIRSNRWKNFRRYTDPLTSEASRCRERIATSWRFRARTTLCNSNTHLHHQMQHKSTILLQTFSAEEKTLWMSTLSPLVGKVISHDSSSLVRQTNLSSCAVSHFTSNK